MERPPPARIAFDFFPVDVACRKNRSWRARPPRIAPEILDLPPFADALPEIAQARGFSRGSTRRKKRNRPADGALMRREYRILVCVSDRTHSEYGIRFICRILFCRSLLLLVFRFVFTSRLSLAPALVRISLSAERAAELHGAEAKTIAQPVGGASQFSSLVRRSAASKSSCSLPW